MTATTTADYYELLGVPPDATTAQIKSAYRKLAKQYHPDVNDSPDAAEKFREITEAYDTLTDPDRRRRYDRLHRTRTGDRCFVVQDNAHTAGLVTPHEVKVVERGRWPSTTLLDIMRPIDEIHTVQPGTPLKTAMEMMGRENVNPAKEGHVRKTTRTTHPRPGRHIWTRRRRSARWRGW